MKTVAVGLPRSSSIAAMCIGGGNQYRISEEFRRCIRLLICGLKVRFLRGSPFKTNNLASRIAIADRAQVAAGLPLVATPRSARGVA